MQRSDLPRDGITGRDQRLAAAIGGFAFALRLAFLLRSPDRAWPHSMLYEGDAPVWARWAAALAAGQPFEFDLPFRTPGVAFLLHALGADSAPFTAAKLLWCAISAATAAALYLVLARWSTRRAALIAAGLCAISHGSFVLATSLNNEALYALLLVLLAGATLAWVERPGWKLSLALGGLHAAALLLRAEHALLLALLLGLAALRAWRDGIAPRRLLAQCALLLLALLALCAPWSLRSHAATQRFNREGPTIPYDSTQPPWTPAARAALERLPAFARAGNFAFLSDLARRGGARQVDEANVRDFFERVWGSTPQALDEWSLVSSKGALDFALANHPDAGGGFSRAALQDGRDDVVEFSFGRPSHLRLVNHGYSIGWGYIAADFPGWLGRVREKLSRFGDGASLGLFASDWPHERARVRQAVDLATPRRGDAIVWRIAVLGTLLAGAALACRRRAAMPWITILVYKLAVVIAFYGYARQAVSIAPALFALSALAVDALCARLPAVGPAQRVGLRWAGGALLALLGAFALYDACTPPRWAARPLFAGGKLSPAPQWGASAFESHEPLALDPIPAGAQAQSSSPRSKM